MKLIKRAPVRPSNGDQEFVGAIRIESSISYDFVVSLRALLNPRTYSRSRRWAAAQLPRLDESIVAKAQFFFAGFDTALGYGAARVVQQLSDDAAPRDLIDAISHTSPTELAMFMLDTGETSAERLAQFREALGGDSSRIEESVEGLPDRWATRCRRVLRHPETVSAELVEVFEAYLSEIYSQHMLSVTNAIADSLPAARTTLELIPGLEAVERLTGGYTVGPDLGLHTITLAPSVFIHPFMSARIDEEAGEALILYGIPSTIFDSYDPEPIHDELVTALKAMSDANRLLILRLLTRQPMYTTEIVRQLHLSQTTVHHHLAQLRTAGLIRQERDRSGMRYTTRVDSAKHVLGMLGDAILNPNSKY